MKKYVEDPAEYLSEEFPGLHFEKSREFCIEESRVPAYIIRDHNACVVNASACMLAFRRGKTEDFAGLLRKCRDTADNGFSRNRGGRRDYNIRLGSTAPFFNRCAEMLGLKKAARSSLFAKKTAIREISAGRPAFLNIAWCRYYRDHTVVAYGFEEYKAEENGKKVLFFRIRDGYSLSPRYLPYRRILGIFATAFDFSDTAEA